MSSVNQGDTQDSIECSRHRVLGPVPAARANAEYANMIPSTAAKFSRRTGKMLLNEWPKHTRAWMNFLNIPDSSRTRVTSTCKIIC